MATTPFGHQLKHYRRLRGMSQLDLALAAGVSPRHISFVETGRSRPGEEMVLKLAESLGIPLREQNELLVSAGFGPVFPRRGLNEPALAQIRGIVERMLTQHEPYPAVVLDRYWNLVKLNGPAERLFADRLGTETPNGIDLFLGHGPLREVIENWAEIAWHTLYRLRREVANVGADAQLVSLLQRAEAYLANVPAPSAIDFDAPALTTKLRLGDARIATISTIASFHVARDVTLDELRVELIFPADEQAEAFFRHAAKKANQP